MRAAMNSDPEVNLNFGAELYRLRAVVRMTQTEVANAAGIARGYYSLIENSRKPPPPLEKVRRIAEAMQLSADDLRRLWGIAAIERSSGAGGESENLRSGPQGLYVVWNGLALTIPEEQQAEIIAILKRKSIM